MSSFNADLATGHVASFNMIIPNGCEDGEANCKPVNNRYTQFDDFLAREVPKIEASPAFGNNGVLGPPPAPQQRAAKWVTTRYFGTFNKARNDKWVFGDRASGAYLHKYAWTKIVRHVVVTGRASPDDPALTQYWADRRRKQPAPQLAGSWHAALRAQQGNCHLCGNQLLDTISLPDSASQAEAWYAALRATLTFQASTARNGDRTINRLVHTRCARRHPDDGPADTAS